jgi:hypothetical protein
MIRMLIFGYSFGIRSERRLCDEGPPQPCLWLVLSLGLDGERPRSFDVFFQEPPRPFSRERSAAQAVRERCGALHERRVVGGEGFGYSLGNGRSLREAAEDPRRFGSDSGHLVADPIGHEVRF